MFYYVYEETTGRKIIHCLANKQDAEKVFAKGVKKYKQLYNPTTDQIAEHRDSLCLYKQGKLYTICIEKEIR